MLIRLELMFQSCQYGGMEVIGILLFLLLVGPLALRFGADSRMWDDRGWWPGAPRAAGTDSLGTGSRRRQAVVTADAACEVGPGAAAVAGWSGSSASTDRIVA